MLSILSTVNISKSPNLRTQQSEFKSFIYLFGIITIGDYTAILISFLVYYSNKLLTFLVVLFTSNLYGGLSSVAGTLKYVIILFIEAINIIISIFYTSN